MDNPRQPGNNLGIMYCAHRKYTLGDRPLYTEVYASWQDAAKQLSKMYDAVCLPLYIGEQYGLSIDTHPFPNRWDSGQVGFIVVSKYVVTRHFGTIYCTKKLIAKAKNILLAEVAEYNTYLQENGNAN